MDAATPAADEIEMNESDPKQECDWATSKDPLCSGAIKHKYCDAHRPQVVVIQKAFLKHAQNKVSELENEIRLLEAK